MSGRSVPRTPGLPSPPRRATPLRLVVLGVGYVLLAFLVWEISDPNVSAAPLWPAAGFTLAAVSVVPTRDWPAVLATIFVADLAANLLQGTALPTGLAWAFANTVEPLLGAIALRWAFRHRGPGVESPQRVLRFFVVVAVAGAPLASLIGALGAHFGYDQDLLTTWRTWYVGDLLGILLVAPVVFVWPRIRAALDLRFAAMMALTAIVSVVIFSDLTDSVVLRPYLLGPVLVLAAFSYGAPGAAVAGLIGIGIADLLSALGHGPYAIEGPGGLDRVIELQVFAAVQLLTVHLFAGLRSQLVEISAHAERLGAEQLVDPLTGAGNRRCLDESLERATTPPRDGRPGDPVAVLFLDLDGFKPINDTHGHTVGDEVLRVVAERLQRMVREGDCVARPGGDEFVLVCPGLDELAADHLAGRIGAGIEEPIAVGGITLHVGASVGFAWIPAPTGRPGALMRAADEAMYRVKSERRLGRRDETGTER